jgi:hypothetical protein
MRSKPRIEKYEVAPKWLGQEIRRTLMRRLAAKLSGRRRAVCSRQAPCGGTPTNGQPAPN